MIKLILTFENHALREINFSGQPLTIGRTPDNDIQIDNLAVSTHHAKIEFGADQLVIEDLSSLNGTFVNGKRVQQSALRHGDSITIGKHEILVRLSGDSSETLVLPQDAPKKFLVPKVEETMVLDTKKRRDMLQQAAKAPEAAPVPVPVRARIGKLVVLRGNTDAPEYLLSSKLTVIGKSQMASVRLKGWFKPKAAAQINKREDGYYVSRADRVPKVNGVEIKGITRLNEGDTIEVAGVNFSFLYSD
ncbi:MAG: FHA domain-containing protein [Acidobacteria bacterium]|nr:FHA domain-containing protein [Acidobacteriota bacterium]MCL5288471.1 FHA domain-containing protein [Acidobacteriota bacterium]